jgi:hypothetical protein
MQRPPDLERVRRGMEKSLVEWGVEPGKNDTHRNFYRKAIWTATSYCGEKESPLEQRLLELRELRVNNFPKDPTAAVEYVLRQELEEEGATFQTIEDVLGLSFAPYYAFSDSRTGKLVVKLNREFSKFSKRQLDPFTRFSYDDIDLQESVWTGWQDLDSLGGYVMEALVVCHIVHTCACQSCFRENVLRYNGGLDEACSWADIVCIGCRATYETKSKRDVQAIEKSFQFGFWGGSFRTFAGFKQLGKRFLLVVSRKASVDVNGSYHHPVTLADIDHVVPRVSSFSFDDTVPVIPLVTTIKHANRRHWCKVPAWRKNHAAIAEEVFNSKYGDGEWIGFGSRDFPVREGSGAPFDGSSRDNPGGEQLQDDIQSLQQALIDLQVGGEDDDWETLYNSD